MGAKIEMWSCIIVMSIYCMPFAFIGVMTGITYAQLLWASLSILSRIFVVTTAVASFMGLLFSLKHYFGKKKVNAVKNAPAASISQDKTVQREEKKNDLRAESVIYLNARQTEVIPNGLEQIKTNMNSLFAALTADDDEQNETALRVLANFPREGKKIELESIIVRLIKQGKIDILNKALKTGPDKGKTIFWILIDLTQKGQAYVLNNLTQALIDTKKINSINLYATPVKDLEGRRTVFWMLVNLAKKGHPEVLNNIILAFIKQGEARKINLSRTVIIEWPDNDKTVLWALIDLVKEGYSGVLYRVIKAHIKGSISEYDLNREITEGYGKGRTLFYLLIDAAINGNYPEELISIFKTLQTKRILNKDGFNVTLNANAEQWQIVLSTLINLAMEERCYKKLLENIIGTLLEKNKINARILNVVQTTGPNKGKTILWMLIDLARKGCSAILNKVITVLASQSNINELDFNVAPTDGPHHDKTALLLLIDIATSSDPQVLNSLIKVLLAKNELYKIDLNAPLTEGQNKGKTILWLLADLAMKGQPGPLNSVILAYIARGEINKLNLNTAPLEWPDKDKTVLWMLIAIAKGNYSGILYSVIKALIEQGNINLCDLNREITEGYGKGKTLFYLLVDAAIKGNYPEELNGVIKALQAKGELSNYYLHETPAAVNDKWRTMLWIIINLAKMNMIDPKILCDSIGALFKNKNISPAALNVAPTYRPDKDKTALWMLLDLAKSGYPEVFNNVATELIAQNELNKLNFSAVPASDADKDKTALSLLFDVVNKGYPELLTNAIKILIAKNKLDNLDFNATLTEGPGKGKTLFSLLIDVAKKSRDMQILNDVITILICSDKLNKTSLNAELATEGPDKGKTILWLLIDLALEGYPGALEHLIKILIDNGKLDVVDLNAVVIAECPNKGKTPLWAFINLAIKGYPTALNDIINNLVINDISKIDFNLAPTDGRDQGKTLFWMLVQAAINGHSEALSTVIEALIEKGKLNELEFNAAPTAGYNKNETVLFMLSYAAINGYQEVLNNIIEHLTLDKIRTFLLNIKAMRPEGDFVTVLSMLCISMFKGCVKSIAKIMAALTQENIATLNLEFMIKVIYYKQIEPILMADGSVIAEAKITEEYNLGTTVALKLAREQEHKALRNLLLVVAKKSANVITLYSEFIELAKNQHNFIPLIILYQCMNQEDLQLLAIFDLAIDRTVAPASIFEADLCRRMYREIDVETLGLVMNCEQHEAYNQELQIYESCIKRTVSWPLLHLYSMEKIDSPHFYDIEDIIRLHFDNDNNRIGRIKSPMTRREILLADVVADDNAMRTLIKKIEDYESLKKLNCILSKLKFPEEITLDKLNDVIMDGIHKGKTLLWLLAHAAGCGHPEFLSQAINQLTLAEIKQLKINAAPTVGMQQGKTVFWLLAYAALHGCPLVIFDKMLHALNKMVVDVDVLNAAPIIGYDKGRTVLEMLFLVYLKNQTTSLKKIITHLPKEIGERLHVSTRISCLLSLLAQHGDAKYLNRIFGAHIKQQTTPTSDYLPYLNLMSYSHANAGKDAKMQTTHEALIDRLPHLDLV